MYMHAHRWKVLNYRKAGQCGDSTVVVLVTGHHDVAITSPALFPAAMKLMMVINKFQLATCTYYNS